MQALSEKLGFIPVSMYELLVDQIRNKTDLGQKIYDDLSNNRLIPDEIVSGILKARISMADCKLHGLVLEGFPKTDSQVKILQEMRFEPDFVVHLDCNEEVSKRRLETKVRQMGNPVNDKLIAER